jgi:signal transduction histidine kinase
MLELTIACVSAVGNLALAVLVFAKNSQKQVNRYFACFAIILAVWAVMNYVSLHPILLNQLTWIRLVMALVAYMCLFVLLLSNTFPTGEAHYKKLSRIAIPFAVCISALALTPWLFSDIHYPGGQVQPVPGIGMVLFVPYAIITLLLGLYILAYKFRHLRGVTREYVRYALIGIVVTFAMLLIFNFLMVVAFKTSAFVAYSPAVGLIFTASFAYGMIRYKLFDVRLIVARFIAYLLLLLFTGGLYGFAAVGVSFVVSGVRPGLTQVIFSTAVVGLLILFVQPLRRFFNRITRAIFYQDDYDTKNILDKLASVLVRSTNTNILAKSSMSILAGALRPEYITILLYEDGERRAERFISVGQNVPDLKSITAVLHGVTDVVSAEAMEAQPVNFHERIQAANVSIVARLKTKGSVIGYCFFGYKTSGSAYTRRDIDLIRIASDELAVAIQNTMRFEQIQDFNDTLRQRVEAATKKLRESNAQLQKLDEAKDEFVSMASHQLRTPLTSVKGYISMVLEGDVGKITKMQRQLLEEAFTSSERMVHLINDFLNVSRLQTGKFILESKPVDLAKVVEQEVASLQTTAAAHNMKLIYRVPAYFPVLYLDDSKIRQVLMNFMDNAIYYSREHTTITVKLFVEDGSAVAEVHDTGIGVPKAEQAHLFTKFFRATNARRQRPDGTGVGLFLAKKVIDAHGGSMVFESVEDEGSTFGFRLPIKKLSTAPKDTDELKK